MTRKAIIFIIGFAIINFSLTRWYLAIMQESHIVQTDINFHDYITSKIPEVIILGNSHTFAISTDSLDNAIHFGSYGETIEKSYYKLKYITDRGLKPDKVLLSYDLGLLKAQGTGLDYFSFYWARYFDAFEFYQQTNDKLDFVYDLTMAKIFPYADGEVDVMDYLFAKDKNQPEEERETVPEKTLIDPSDNCFDDQLSELGVFYLKSTLELARNNGIQLVLVRFPVTTDFYARHTNCFDDIAYYEWLNQNVMDDKANVLDYHDLYEDSLFRDPHHLKPGDVRAAFSGRIKNDLQSL